MTHPAPFETRDKGNRSWVSRFHTGIECEHYGDTGEVLIKLSTHHDKERKQYYTAASKIEFYGNIVRWKMNLRGEEVTYARLSTEPTARYNAKRLAELHTEAIAQFRALDDTSAAGQLAALTTEG